MILENYFDKCRMKIREVSMINEEGMGILVNNPSTNR